MIGPAHRKNVFPCMYNSLTVFWENSRQVRVIFLEDYSRDFREQWTVSLTYHGSTHKCEHSSTYIHFTRNYDLQMMIKVACESMSSKGYS